MGTLYKFRSFRNPHHLKLIEDGEIWFASPESFNDPFDCNIPFRIDKCPEDWQIQRMIEYALSQNPSLTAEEALAKAEQESRESSVETMRWLRTRQFKEAVSPKVGILSLARNWNAKGSELMWSHYTDSHTGFAVGFDEERMLNWMRGLSGIPLGAVKHPSTPGLNVRPAPVHYCREMPSILPCEDDEATAVYKLLTHKSAVWEYEDEVRYLLMSLEEDLSLGLLSDSDRGLGMQDVRTHSHRHVMFRGGLANVEDKTFDRFSTGQPHPGEQDVEVSPTTKPFSALQMINL